ncbi:MAG: ABC transporter permease [Candidatus Bipolaricaulia bacterium]
MAQAVQEPSSGDQASGLRLGSVLQFLRYIVVRLLILAATVVVAVYVMLLIVNAGGYVDQVRMNQIRQQVIAQVSSNPELQKLPTEERRERIQAMIKQERERLGLNKPFWPIAMTEDGLRLVPQNRSFNHLSNAITLTLGRASQVTSDTGSKQVRLILLERLPPTLLLLGTGFLILFFSSLIMALVLSRRYGTWLDRIMVSLAPTSAAPSWFYGIFLILIFAAVLGWLPFGGLVDAPVPESALAYSLSVLEHLILPVVAFWVSGFFLAVYQYRTYFLIYSSEDYVEMARAKGLPSGTIQRRYILRPTLPYIVTQFLLSVITLWQGAVVLEIIFNWPGLGRLLFQAINQFDVAVIIGSVAIYAYLLAIAVFMLDIIYALVDPRIRVGEGSG